MSDKSWKANERAFAKWVSEWVSKETGTEVEFRRNRANKDSDDRNLNSDVDIIHPFFAVKSYEGITAELTRRKQGLSSIYKWYRANKEKDNATITVVNRQWAIMDRDSFAHVWSLAKMERRDVPLFALMLNTNIKQVHTGLALKVIEDKTEQSNRYGENKNLLPIVVVRGHNQPQLIIIDASLLTSLLT